MFLDDEAPRRHRPLKAILPLVLIGTGHALAATLLSRPEGLLFLVLAAALLMAARSPFRSESALVAAAIGDAGALLLLRLPLWGQAALIASLGTLLWLLAWCWREARRRSEARRLPLLQLLEEGRTQAGTSLLELSRRGPILLVCLRHFGCSFCREALERLARDRSAIEASGVRLVLVHQSDEAGAARFLDTFGLGGVDRVSDPRRWLYFHLGLRQGGPWQLLGPKVWFRALAAGVLKRHGLGRVQGDVRQLPGVFLIRDGVVLAAHVHRTAADNPDFRALAQCPS